jgi:hypothetical protein
MDGDQRSISTVPAVACTGYDSATGPVNHAWTEVPHGGERINVCGALS